MQSQVLILVQNVAFEYMEIMLQTTARCTARDGFLWEKISLLAEKKV